VSEQARKRLAISSFHNDYRHKVRKLEAFSVGTACFAVAPCITTSTRECAASPSGIATAPSVLVMAVASDPLLMPKSKHGEPQSHMSDAGRFEFTIRDTGNFYECFSNF